MTVGTPRSEASEGAETADALIWDFPATRVTVNINFCCLTTQSVVFSAWPPKETEYRKHLLLFVGEESLGVSGKLLNQWMSSSAIFFRQSKVSLSALQSHVR